MDINGWDFICACTVEKLNALLAAQFRKNVPSLSYVDGNGSTLTAQFDPWRIIPGGSASKLYMELPIKSGSLASVLSAADLSGAVIVVAVELDFVANAKSGTTDLKFDFATTATGPNDTTKGSIYVSNPDATGILAQRDSSGTLATQVHDAIPQCLIANKAKLDYVFASLNLTPSGDGSWLAPKQTAYSYIAGQSGSDGYLAVLSVLDGRSIAGLSTQIDDGLFDGSSDVFAAFAGPVFLEYMVMPHLSSAYEGASAAWFTCTNGTIANLPGIPLICAPVKVGLINYQPILTSLAITIKSSTLHSAVEGMFDITGLTNSYVTFSESQDASCSYDKTAGQLSFAATGDPVVDYEKHIPVWLYIVAAPAILAFGLIIGGIVVAIVDGVIAAVSTAVAKATTGSSSNLAVADWSAQAVQWPGSATWTINEAGLSDAFYIRCKL